MTKYRVVDEDKAIGEKSPQQVEAFLENMAQDGWQLVSAVAYPKKGGVYTRYFFTRLAVLAQPQNEEDAA